MNSATLIADLIRDYGSAKDVAQAAGWSRGNETARYRRGEIDAKSHDRWRFALPPRNLGRLRAGSGPALRDAAHGRSR